MISSNPGPSLRQTLVRASFFRPLAALVLLWLCCGFSGVLRISAAPVAGPASQNPVGAPETDSAPHFNVETYDVEGGPKISMDVVFPILSKYTGTNVSLTEIARAAFALQAEYRKAGYPKTSLAIATGQITNGVVTVNVFQASLPQIMISGVRYLSPTNSVELPAWSLPPTAVPHPAPELAVTNGPPPPPPAPWHPPKPATPEQIAAAAKFLSKEMARIEVEENDRRVHVVSTNGGPGYDIEHYVILGNTVLSPQTIAATLTNIDGAFGTNVSFAGVRAAVEQLQQAYHERGYVTVSVTVPKQTLTNATVKLQVLEGRLEKIDVVGAHYFSSNNVMASLPSLHPNTVLNSYVFNSELMQANLNQDRQIYPLVGPGTNFGESQLTLTVKDRIPLHAKVELNNQNSPGTPDLRLNTSAVYDNLWQAEHALGVQYGFSPEQYKQGPDWPFYDAPIVADYSVFYRLPLGSPESVGETLANNHNFGYSEATRQFVLPPSSGQAQLTIYANRAAIDTSVQAGLPTSLVSSSTPTNSFNLSQQSVHQDITVNEDIGFQLSKPLPEMDGFRSALSGGLDFKVYSVNSFETNVFSEIQTSPANTNNSSEIIPLANTVSRVEYLPISLSYNASFQDVFGPANAGLSLSANLWYSGYSVNYQNPGTPADETTTTFHGLAAFTNTIHSTQATGHWVVLRPSFSQEIEFYTNWITTFRLDGQWASEPLLSIEQYGAGGVNSVRGYHEGEVFGDEGWHVGLEQQTAPLIVGDLYGGMPLAVRASVFTDYARVYSIDTLPGTAASTPLFGAGFGFNASVGPVWQAQFLCSWPLLNAGTVQAGRPYFSFDLTAQF